jgi:hypothetical protein
MRQSLFGTKPIFPEGSQRSIAQADHVTFASAGGRNDALCHDLLDHSGLSGVVQFLARRIKSLAHDAGRDVVEDTSRNELQN